MCMLIFFFIIEYVYLCKLGYVHVDIGARGDQELGAKDTGHYEVLGMGAGNQG